MLRLNIKAIPKTWFLLFIIIIFLGIFFRITNIENKVYWVDEVATSIRVSGYTKQEVTQNLFNLKLITVKDLQQYQKLTVQKDLTATIKALIKSPEHSPLYFILTRFWVQRFGSSVVATRSLSVVFGLLAIPCVYWLCQELFKTPLVSWVAVALFAVSPFYVAYSQEARPYSLWIVTILSSNIALLRAIRLKNKQSWLLYTVSLTISFYTSLFSIFVAIGQSIYIIFLEKFNLTKTVKRYLLAFTLGIISFLPWLFIIFYNWQRFQDNTTWMRVPISLPIKIVIWIYSIAIVFVESPIYKGFDAIIITRIVTDLSLFALIIWAFYFLLNQAPRAVKLFILTSTIVPTLLFILVDLIFDSKTSTAPRYIVPCQLGILLTLAYFLANKLLNKQFFWRTILITLISIEIMSCIFILNTSPKYQKTRNIYNIPIAATLNQAKAPVLIAETKETLDIISLSYQLEATIKIQFLPQINLSQLINSCENVFLFNPSTIWQSQLTQQFKLKQVYKPNLLTSDEIALTLWTVKGLNNNCL
ncbi:glycosyltransferase family 39 protein [Chlorogloea sp. CCALA 695]|uniref:glycosyltransferase family 39 protein n=1 Tax=Chlorogloea sp. CCALA 695 TaxID=2107693 RepID=UPI000D085ABB|nr:glycosyltransferase family 39 protein [Chlorogloea sp. CCALA 695]PSB27336.1 hypothetical protein C7B70_22830 [Chlorogloea sp. CCALA 695]